MDKYRVEISPQAYRELDEIYAYIAENLLAPDAAFDTVEAIEKAIFSLDSMPQRGPERKVGAYAYKGYRQLFVKNYTVVYRIEEYRKTVLVVTVKYSPSEF